MSFFPRSILVIKSCHLTCFECEVPSRIYPVKLDQLLISASLSINTLLALLSGLDVSMLLFTDNCQIMNMTDYSPLSDQVSETNNNIKVIAAHK